MPTSTTLRLALLLTAVGVIAGCATPPSPSDAGKAPTSAPAPSPVVESSAPAASAEPATAAPAAPSGPVSSGQQQQAQKLAMVAVEMLEAGNEDQARAEIQSALSTDPNNKLAQSLLKQITGDPVALLGRESFSYTVRSTDTLSLIARRFLGDVFSFYILARYNDIKVPKQVAAGQVLRIPGKAPPPGADREPAAPARPAAPVPPPQPPAVAAPPAPPAPTATAEPTPGVKAMRSAEAAERAGDLDRALADYNRAAGLDQAAASGKAAEVRRKLVQKHSQIARSAFAKQDLDGSIRNWDRVLELDAGNDAAKLERQRAVALKEKLKGLGK